MHLRTASSTGGWRLLVAVGGVLAAFSAVADSYAEGGASIAEAPTLPLDTLVSGGGPPSHQYYRLPVTGGDKITLNVDRPEGACQAALILSLFRPDVTDYQISAASPVQTTGITPDGGKREYIWTSPFTGAGILQAAGCNNGIVPFTLIVSLAHKTAVRVQGPAVARRGSKVRISATISSPAGTPRGSCLIARRVAQVVNGRCFKRVSLGRGSRQTVIVSFIPDDGWLEASGRRIIRLFKR